ncbi:MAG: 2,3,4,5-tetrahydropyridine-2,6-dicarboxylate N-succinyltransferase, partial [Dongiaceae bacterium]
MNLGALEKTIDAAWENRTSLTPASSGDVRKAVAAALDA